MTGKSPFLCLDVQLHHPLLPALAPGDDHLLAPTTLEGDCTVLRHCCRHLQLAQLLPASLKVTIQIAVSRATELTFGLLGSKTSTVLRALF